MPESAKSWLARKSTSGIETIAAGVGVETRPTARSEPRNRHRQRLATTTGTRGAEMGSRTAVLAALLASLTLSGLPGIMAAAAQGAAQSVPLPVPPPQPKTYGPPAVGGTQQRPPAGLSQQPAPAPQAPSVFPRPSFLFGRGETTAFDARQRALADRVSTYLSNVRQLTGDFVQVGPDGSKSEGEFYLQKPGRVRFDYNPPSPIELIADGQSVVVRDRKLATQDLYPLSQTPLRFLLADRIDLLRDTNLIGVYGDDVFVTIVIEERQIITGTHRLMMMFGAQDYQLRQWTVTDPQGLDTTVAVYNLDTRRAPDPSLFRIDYTRPIQ
jgi:outer membrane lipoprotein-sorting protein